MKCGEERPSCRRCTDTGRKCDGYAATPVSRRDLPVAINGKKTLLLSSVRAGPQASVGDSAESRYFDHFRRSTVYATNEYFGSELWSRLVLQLCHEPAIRHGALALSSLHQDWNLNGPGFSNSSGHALVQYAKAIKHAHALLQRVYANANVDRNDLTKVLVACILFISYENTMGNYKQGMVHLRNGLNIGHKHLLDCKLPMRCVGTSLTSRTENEIVDCLERFHFQAQTFAEARDPECNPATTFLAYVRPPLPSSFECLNHARRYIINYCARVFVVGEVMVLSDFGEQLDPDLSLPVLHAVADIEREKARLDVEQWHVLFERLVATIAPSPATDAMADYLRIYYWLAVVLSRHDCDALELSYDEHLTEFERSLDCVETLHRYSRRNADTRGSGGGSGGSQAGSSFTLDLGICAPVFAVAQKCRDPRVRRRAIALLDATQRKEGMWEGSLVARVAERMVAWEERRAAALRGGELVGTAADIPMAARIIGIDTRVLQSEQKVMAKFITTEGSFEETVRC